MKDADCERRGQAVVAWDRYDIIVCRVLGVIHVCLGIATAVGGSIRFPPPNYAALLAFSHGHIWPYAALWIAGGMFMVFSRRRHTRMVGLGTSIVITNLWAALFAVAAFKFDDAAYTASIAYGGYGLVSAVLMGMMLVHGRPSRRGG